MVSPLHDMHVDNKSKYVSQSLFKDDINQDCEDFELVDMNKSPFLMNANLTQVTMLFQELMRATTCTVMQGLFK